MDFEWIFCPQMTLNDIHDGRVVHNSQIRVNNKKMFTLFRANSWRSILTVEYDSLNGSKNKLL